MAEINVPSWQFNPDEGLVSDRPLIYVCHRRSKFNNLAEISSALGKTFPDSQVDTTDETPGYLSAYANLHGTEIQTRGGIFISEATAYHDTPMTLIAHLDDVIDSVSSEIQVRIALIAVIDPKNSEAWTRLGPQPTRDKPQGPARLKAQVEARNIQAVYAQEADIETALTTKLELLKRRQLIRV